MKTITKKDLAEWLVNENNNCGKDTYFSTDLRGAMTIEESFKKFMTYSKDELISIIYNFSIEGQKFMEKNNLI